MTGEKTRSKNLSELCIAEARAIVEQHGIETLSLREVARRLGVSHGAPYRHFPTRDHLLAELVARAFADFAAWLDARQKTGVAERDLAEMGKAYLAYALAHPLNYRLMFDTPVADPDAHPDMMREARHAFALLRDGLQAAYEAERRSVDPAQLDLDALFVWSSMHGMAGVMSGRAITQIGLSAAVLAAMPQHALNRIRLALGLNSPDEA